MQSLEKIVTVFQHQKFKENKVSNVSKIDFREINPEGKVVVNIAGVRRSIPASELAITLALIGNTVAELDNIYDLLRDVIDPDLVLADLVDAHIDFKKQSGIITKEFFVGEKKRQLKEAIAEKRKELEGVSQELANLEAKLAEV